MTYEEEIQAARQQLPLNRARVVIATIESERYDNEDTTLPEALAEIVGVDMVEDTCEAAVETAYEVSGATRSPEVTHALLAIFTAGMKIGWALATGDAHDEITHHD